MIVIDVSSAFIYAANVVGSGARAGVSGLSVIPMEGKRPVSESSIDEDALYGLLKNPIAKYRHNKVGITFSDLPVISDEYVFPYVKSASRQKAMIHGKLFSALNPEEYIADYDLAEIFEDEQIKKARFITYVVPKGIVETAHRLIRRLGKTPAFFNVAQDAMKRFAACFIPDQSCLVVNVSTEYITLHLINKPGSIITRTSHIETGAQNGLLPIDISENEGLIPQIKSQIAKILQYQFIKYNGTPIEHIYLAGSQVTGEMAVSLSAEMDMPVGLIPAFSSGVEPEKAGVFCYAVGSAL